MGQTTLFPARYIGNNPNLMGRKALVRQIPMSIYLDAQFTDIDTGLSHSWHEFYARDFEIIPWSTNP